MTLAVPTPYGQTRHREQFATDFGASPSRTGAQNTAAIQRALDRVEARGGGEVVISQPGEYTLAAGTSATAISRRSALTIGDNCTLRCEPGVTMKLGDSQNCNMLSNADPIGGNSNIGIVGGRWDANEDNNVQQLATAPYFYGVHFYLRGIDGLYIADHIGVNGIKYVYWLTNCTDFTAERITYDNPSDGIHLGGGCSRGVIRDHKGFTGDNLVALICSEGPYFGGNSESAGDITDIEISGIFPEGSAEPLRMAPASGETIARIKVDGIYGSVKSDVPSVVRLQDGPTGVETGGVFKSISISNIDCTGGTAGGIVANLLATGCEDIKLRNLRTESQGGVAIHGGPYNQVSIEDVIVRGATATRHGVTVNASVAQLDIDGVQLDTTQSASMIKLDSGIINSLRLGRNRMTANGASASGIFFNGATVQHADLGTLDTDTATYSIRASGGEINADAGRLIHRNGIYAVFASGGSGHISFDSLKLVGSANGRANIGGNADFGVSVRPHWRHFRVRASDFAGDSASASVDLTSMLRGYLLQGIKVKHEQAFTGGSVTAATIDVGTNVDADRFAAAHNVFGAPSNFSGWLVSSFFAADQTNNNRTLRARLNVTGGTIGDLTQGHVDVFVLVSATVHTS